MMAYEVFLLFFMAIATANGQSSLSLLHTSDEIAQIKKTRQAFQPWSGEESPSKDKTCLFHLSGFIHTGPNLWTLWINGQRFNAEKMPHITVINVTEKKVIFQVLYQKKNLQFQINPNETYDLCKQKIIK